jgi:type II secretory pathway predicted ATPase ExeA/pSer/pThr/pTyr-binding forkhead associated (FHA) protein
MESTIWFTDGFVVITGEIGSGKTTLIETFLKEIEQDVVVAQINQTQVTPIEFLQTALVQFGFNPFRMRKAELLATLNNFLIEQYANGRKVLLIIDEAQNLSHKVLEEVRLLSGVEATNEKVLRIILAGQPELSDKLDSDELVQLRQRVRLRFHLTALSDADTVEYVRHRLRIAGSGDREIFEPDTFPVIFRYTGGIPRLVNTLCDTALIAAYAQDRTTVSAGDVAAAVNELQWVEYAARTSSNLRYGTDDTASNAQPPIGRLVLTLKGSKVQETYLVPGRIFIGRTSDNDLQVESKYVSRHHAQVVTTTEGSWLEDLNSTNGVFLHGRRVRRHRLQEGEVLKLGMHELAYYRTDPPGAATMVLPADDDEAEEPEDADDEDGDEGREAEDGDEG